MIRMLCMSVILFNPLLYGKGSNLLFSGNRKEHFKQTQRVTDKEVNLQQSKSYSELDTQ